MVGKGKLRIMKLVDVKKILKNKVGLILLIGLFGALCVGGFKYIFTPTISTNGNFIYNRVFQIENIKDFTHPNIEFNYLGIINSNASFLKLIEQTEDKVFDYRKINSSWKRINQQQKVEWLRSRVIWYNYHDYVFEMAFIVPNSNISDLNYLSNNINLLIDAFLLSGSDLINKVKPHAVIKTVNSSVILPEKIQNDKKVIAFRYAFYGLIAGLFLSTALFIGLAFFKDIHY